MAAGAWGEFVSIFGSIFNSSARDEKQAIEAYEHAGRYRKGRLLKFRLSAMKSLQEQFPDAKFLISMHFPSFIMHSAQKGAVAIGFFADVIFPEVPYVSSMDKGPSATQERREAVDKFEKLVAAFDSPELARNAPPDSDDFTRAYIESIIGKGFYILRTIPVELIVRLTLKRNDHLLAMADWWNVQSPQHFFDAVALNLAVATGRNQFSDVDVRIDFLSGPKRNYFIFKTIFDDSGHVPELREQMQAEVSGLYDVLPSLGNSISPPEFIGELDESEFEELSRRFLDIGWRDDDSKSYQGHLT